MNLLTRGIWLILNALFGAALSTILFYWVACDMHVPLIVTDFLGKYLPILTPLFRAPYVRIDALSSSIVGKLAFDAFLVAIFGFCHTFFAQESVQASLSRSIFPKQTLRTIYCIMVSVNSFIIIGFWQHTNIQLWNWLSSTMSIYEQEIILMTLYSIIFAPGCYVLLKFNLIEFCGVKQLVRATDSRGCPLSSSPSSMGERTTGIHSLITSGLFRLCRHPLYLFTILGWLITPVMSLDRLAFIIYACLYLVVGVPVEERKLVKIFGQSYIDYQRRVPAIIPSVMSKEKAN